MTERKHKVRSGPMDNLISNVKEVEGLLDIHRAITPRGPGRRTNVEVLHKSCIVLLCACWEAFVEDLVASALEELMEHGKDFSVFPDNVLQRIGDKLHGINAWQLAGNRWRIAMRNNYRSVLSQALGLNSPKTGKVDELFFKVIGIKSISSVWSWRGMSAKRARCKLDELVELRGSIAHKVKASKSVRLKDAEEAREFIFRLATVTFNKVYDHLWEALGGESWWIISGPPWVRQAYGAVKRGRG